MEDNILRHKDDEDIHILDPLDMVANLELAQLHGRAQKLTNLEDRDNIPGI
jgi:hypothetical protein